MDEEPHGAQHLSDPGSDSEASSVSLISRALHSTTLRVTALERLAQLLADRIGNLQDRLQALELAHSTTGEQVIALRQANEALQDRLATAQENTRLLEAQADIAEARAEHQSIALARVSRRLEAVERLLELHRIN